MKHKFLKAVIPWIAAFLLTACTSPIESLTNAILFKNDIQEPQVLIDAFDYEEKYIGHIHTVRYFAENNDSKGTVIHFHGNAQNIFTVNESLFEFLAQGYDLFLFDYSGYGKSSGEPSQKVVHHDAVKILEYVFKHYAGKSIVIYAQSLGGAVFLRALQDIEQSQIDEIHTVIIEGSFLSYKAVAKERYLFLHYFAEDTYSASQFKKRIKAPVIIIHSKKDRVIPFAQGVALHKHLKNSYFIEHDAGHIQFLDKKSNRERLFQYLSE
jgi:alpha-beta hydrolase superfamily lysophospholipase